jgi:hypothetical protein
VQHQQHGSQQQRNGYTMQGVHAAAGLPVDLT